MNRFALLLICFIAIMASPCWGQEPSLLRDQSFTCATFADAVNHYVALGEEKTVKEFETLDEDRGRPSRRRRGFSMNERIGWLCRALFEPKTKTPLRPPRFGALELPMDMLTESKTPRYKNWPLYPVALSGSTYFVLSEGYFLGGFPEPLKQYLAYCRANGVFRKTAVAVPTRRQAIEDCSALRQSAAWQALKWKESGPNFTWSQSEKGTWKFIQRQADAIPASE